jgi:bifunctional non-homologous end joining protein LigD
MSLQEYKRKRHFKRTPEPIGKKASGEGRSFVIQKHAASHLHYDFRLELNGVLKSWAVPKGPSLDPSVKRLAMHVEDHPVEYGSFEGIIPQGEYGGGTVMLWDHGTWEPIGDPHEGYRSGKLKFKLAGEKLRGAWMLVRIKGKSPSDKDQKQWLLFKERDEDAKPASKGDVLEELPLSVSTGRSLDDIAADRDWVWGSNAKTNGKAKAKTSRSRTSTPHADRKAAAGTKEPRAKTDQMPKRVDVALATLAKEAPNGDEWFHEVKFDGYRIICRIDDEQVELISRNHKDWTKRLGVLAEAVKTLPVTQAIFDGEVVAMRADGITDFQELQNAFREHRADELQYYIFDLLFLNGRDLTQLPLEERKRQLADLLEEKGISPHIHFSEHVEGDGPSFLKKACEMRLEGIISKRRDQSYEPGRGYSWLKVKCLQNDEFVIGGYTDPTGSRAGFGALLLGYHDKKGELTYAGKVGTGFDDHMLHALRKQLQAIQRDLSPFTDRKRTARGVHWVDPTLVAQVAFGAWTRDGLLRHASFQGLREDKPAGEVTRDKAVPVETAVKKGKAMSKTARDTIPTHRNNGDVRATGKATSDAQYDVGKQELAGVRLTHPDKVLYPEEGITKIELANYYRSIADWILPHIEDRPLVLVRCPDGQGKECFYQKHPGPGVAESLRQIPIREKTKTEKYVIVDDASGLISLVQVGALEIHAWGSRADKLETPDRLIFDLDPDPEVPWNRVVQSARQVRQFLQELGLESFLKTTGGKGLHLVVPIDRRHDWDEAKAFCKNVADLIVAADPDHYTANMAKAARPGKIFIDYLRNGRGSTAVVPYSTRAKPNASVSVPLTWEELSLHIHSDQFTVRNLSKRLASLKADPWDGIDSIRQALTVPLKKLRTLSRS